METVMKINIIYYLLVWIFCLSGTSLNSQQNQTVMTVLKGPYLGQKPPGDIPVIFAPGIVSTEAWESAITFSPDGKQCFFTRRTTWEGSDNRLFYSKEENERWTQPEPAIFSKNYMDWEPNFSPDGKRVYFSSDRPKPDGSSLKGYIWIIDKTDSGWSRPKYFNTAVNNTTWNEYATITKNGNIYFESMIERKYGVFRSQLVSEIYQEPEFVFNGGGHPFVAPDESYVIFDAPDGNAGIIMDKKSLFISFRKKDGSWTKADKLGLNINSTYSEMAASVSFDGKYMFFYRTVNNNGDIYWVDAKFIDEMRLKKGE
jgi:hypothetical protein